MHVFYQPDLSAQEITLTEEESKHCIRVLRMQKGSKVDLADGRGTHAEAVIVDDHPKKCKLSITQRTFYSKQQSSGRKYHLHLFIAPTKNFERMEWLLEKATEVGIDEITFVYTTNSERDKVNLERCEKILVSAMKQSKQWYLPELHPMVAVSDIFNLPYEHKLLAWCEADKQNGIADYFIKNKPEKLALLIGPEGDFTATETALAKQNNWQMVSLGQTILRTETAGLFGVMSAKALLS